MAPATCTWRTWLTTMQLGSEKWHLTRRSSTRSKNVRTCAWPCAKWSNTSRTRKLSCTKSTTRSTTSILVTMWSRLASTTTRASQRMRACTNRHYNASGHCTSTLLTRIHRCATPTNYQRTLVVRGWGRGHRSISLCLVIHDTDRLATRH